MRTILREAQDHPERLQSQVRKWLTYIALLLTASAMICDLIVFLDYFLAGELTSRFVLKVLTVLLICGGIFFYYLSGLRWDRNTNVSWAKKLGLKFGAVAAAVVAVSFCIGLGVAGPPSTQRHVQADSRRVEDLKRIAAAIAVWYRRANVDLRSSTLPAALHNLAANGVDSAQIVDPEAKLPYEYEGRSGATY